MNKQTFKSLAKYLLLGYFIYIVITAVVLFAIPLENETLASDFTIPWINETTERVVLIEDRTEALKVRFDLMNHAEKTLDISYYSMQGGDSVDLFYVHILKAADRGVKVRFAVDGLAHNMRFGDRDIIQTFTKHPNIELVFYEPLDLLRPWTWHNRLHDKLMIADQAFALIGGRNIGDKYFAPKGYQGASNDFDLLLFGEDPADVPVIDQMQGYFDDLWSHDYSVLKTDRHLSIFDKRGAHRMKERLMETYQTYLKTYSDFHLTSIDWTDRSHEIKRGFYVHNSIDRFAKEPAVWEHLLELASKAETEVVIQSPYIIPGRQMRRDLTEHDFEFEQGIMLTNGMASSPNVLAHSGYQNYREDLANSAFDLYEYQDPDQSLHMKSIVIDQQIASVGSFNLDSRSMNLNTESMVVLDSPSLANEIITTIDLKYMPDSIHVDSIVDEKESIVDVPVLKRIVVMILRPLTRIFDFLL